MLNGLSIGDDIWKHFLKHLNIVVMLVAWKISDVLLELIYDYIDYAILSSPSGVNELLEAEFITKAKKS